MRNSSSLLKFTAWSTNNCYFLSLFLFRDKKAANAYDVFKPLSNSGIYFW